MLEELLALVAPPLCWECGAPAARAGPLCRRCRSLLRWLAPEPVEAAGIPAWAPVAYDGPARALVRGLKFRSATALAEAMAAQMAARAPPDLLACAELVPVPLPRDRLRLRGFNQAERLACALAERTGLSVADCLERRGHTRPQVGRARADRLAAMDGSVAAASGAGVPERSLLVDDVITTGATLAACAAALRAAGARTVAAIAYARVLGR